MNVSQPTDKPAGTIIGVGRKAILVACGKEADKAENTEQSASTLAITHLQFAGGKPMTAEQVCHGNQLNDGDLFTIDSK